MVGYSQGTCILESISRVGSFEMKEERDNSVGYKETETELVLRDKSPPSPAPALLPRRGTLAHEFLGMCGCTREGRQTQRERELG